MTALRVLIAVPALAAAVAGLLLPQPEVFSISGSSALLMLILSCGAIAADALPLQRWPLLCSVATLPLCVLLVRPFEVTPIALAILALQVAAWWLARRGRRSGGERRLVPSV